ncbi:hypothetical protein CAS74_002089 [Pichia kudriavzevii]|uniref:Putative transporter MCH4 n=1 Tax=Pichia kudriavzevii TaxID=4909 RepID=A0A1V2LKJ5_PICKU|nr:uncharacterized protein C5L36_0D01250 [Pichia kudriavzevii]AWU77388.1 hypothetical protein C5L36_0D01250 [Pichia kudriavzevii]ONH73031.1 putative transporter MCH4 [Pichia kudriavzevii]OUT22371.1 hypothetical protein CAS74_002089 [Pichia kudriavzevii]
MDSDVSSVDSRLEKDDCEQQSLIAYHKETASFPDGGRKAWLTVLGAFFGLMTVFGIMDTMASIQLYIAKHQLANEKMSSISWVFSLYMFTNLSMGVITGPIFDVYGFKWVLVAGTLLNCGGLYATAFCKELWQFVLAFGLCTGIGGGILMTPLLGVVSHWFWKRRGLALGLANCGNVSSVYFPIMLRSLYPKLGYTKTMVIMASICVFLLMLAFVLIEDRSEELNVDKEGTKWERLMDSYKHMINLKSFKEKNYTLLVIGLFLEEFSIIIAITYIATYGSVRGVSESTTYIIVTVMNASGIPAKVILNYMSDKIGRYNTMLGILAVMTISFYAIWLPYYNLGGYFAFAVVYGIVFGSAYSITPVVISQISKTNEFGQRYATAYFFVAFGNLIAMPIGSQFINEETVTNYNHMIIFAGATCACATVFAFASRTTMVGWKLKVWV